MAIKREELVSGCIAKAADDEPVFVLRAQDKLAPDLVREWAHQAGLFLGAQHPKVIESLKLADLMEQWPTRKYPD